MCVGSTDKLTDWCCRVKLQVTPWRWQIASKICLVQKIRHLTLETNFFSFVASPFQPILRIISFALKRTWPTCMRSLHGPTQDINTSAVVSGDLEDFFGGGDFVYMFLLWSTPGPTASPYTRPGYICSGNVVPGVQYGQVDRCTVYETESLDKCRYTLVSTQQLNRSQHTGNPCT